MLKLIRAWYERYFSDQEALILLFSIFAIFSLILLTGDIFAPVLVSIVIVYILEWFIVFLKRMHVPNNLAVFTTYFLFLGLFSACLFLLMPLIWQQMSHFFNELPDMLTKGQDALFTLSDRYPQFISPEQITHTIQQVKTGLADFGKSILSVSISSIPAMVTLMIYAVLVPLLVFFFIKDREELLAWAASFLPKKRRLLKNVWHEVNDQIGNYIRGKIIETLIVGVVTYIAFLILGLQYTILLSALVGLSVIVPFVGAIVVTIPVVVVGYIQWGMTTQYGYLLVVYTIIATLDANLLVPLLYSEAVSLHPVSIIIAILFFGGLWGFWGVFFSIPLATLVKAVFQSWPRVEKGSA